MDWQIATQTHRGNVRKINEDALLVEKRYPLLVVADGMGGHQGGNRASALAIDLLINQLLNSMHWFFQMDRDLEEREQGFIEDLKKLLQRAHEAIEQESSADAGSLLERALPG